MARKSLPSKKDEGGGGSRMWERGSRKWLEEKEEDGELERRKWLEEEGRRRAEGGRGKSVWRARKSDTATLAAGCGMPDREIVFPEPPRETPALREVLSTTAGWSQDHETDPTLPARAGVRGLPAGGDGRSPGHEGLQGLLQGRQGREKVRRVLQGQGQGMRQGLLQTKEGEDLTRRAGPEEAPLPPLSLSGRQGRRTEVGSGNAQVGSGNAEGGRGSCEFEV